MPKLFHVTVDVELDMVVLAETAEQARAWARDNWHTESRDGCPNVTAYMPVEIKSEAQVPYEDWLDAPPYAADNSSPQQTVKEMLSAKGEPTSDL